MKKSILFFLILAQYCVFAQELSKDFKVSAFEPYAVIDAYDKEYISLDNGEAFAVKFKGALVYTQKFDANQMKEVSNNVYKDFPVGYVFVKLLKVDNRIYVLYELFNKKEGSNTLYARELNTADAQLKEPVELLKSSRKVVALYGDVAFGVAPRSDKYTVQNSFDGSKILIAYRLSPLVKSDKENYDELGMYVFDNQLKKISGNEVKLPYTEAQINNLAYAVSRSGDVKLLIANREKEEFEMLSINQAGEVSIHNLGISSKKTVVEFKMVEDESGNFNCGGFYANGIEFKVTFTGTAFVMNINGLLYFEVSKEGSLIKQNSFDFSADFISQNLSDREKEKVKAREAEGKAGIADLLLTDFIVKPDGSLLFVGERRYVRQEYYGPQQKMVYHYTNIVLIKVDSNGELAWMKKLAKNQAGLDNPETVRTCQMGYAFLEGKTCDYIAFVDNPKNISLSADGGVPESHKDGMGGYLTTYKINYETGELEKHTICDLNNIDGQKAYQFNPRRIFKAEDGKFLMEIYIKNKQDDMVKFEIL